MSNLISTLVANNDENIYCLSSDLVLMTEFSVENTCILDHLAFNFNEMRTSFTVTAGLLQYFY